VHYQKKEQKNTRTFLAAVFNCLYVHMCNNKSSMQIYIHLTKMNTVLSCILYPTLNSMDSKIKIKEKTHALLGADNNLFT